jgi:2-polyprenyl-6-methoxyphenol hydroxylase-like FAD-dependent oxidoreductase
MRDESTPAFTGAYGRRHAAVVGAGIGGLLAGRVLAGYFDRVTILERDILPYDPVSRKGVPQDRHLHSMATRGREILERYFPGLDAELAAAGCPSLDQTWDVCTDTPAGRLPRFRSGVTMRAASRSLLEKRVRNRLEADPKIHFLAGREVVGLVPDTGGSAIVGVRTRRRGSMEAEVTLIADLVVDASGQGSRAPRWLEELGYDALEEEIVDPRLGYATRWFRVPEDLSGDWKGLAVLPGWPDNTRGGTLRQVEGDVWTVVLIGLGGDYPPTRGDAFLEFARTLPSPTIYDAIKDAEPVSPVYGYRRTANRRRRYEWTRLPENFLVTGDAACSLNPSYGSGMTAVALSAEVLDGCLRERRGQGVDGALTNLGRRFHERQAAAVEVCWKLTTNTDRQWLASSVEELGIARRLLHQVSREILALAVEREDVARTLLEVKNLLAPPSALLRPGTLLPALRRSALSLLGARREPRLRANTPISDLISNTIYLVSPELSVPFFCFWETAAWAY